MAWDTVYSADPYAMIFGGRGCLEVTPDRWLVLTLQPDSASSEIAFLALARDGSWGKLRMAGNPWADHTGFVCLPRYERKAFETFARFIQQDLEWDVFKMRDVFDPRLDLFLNCFPSNRFDVQRDDGISCPYIPLPDTWERYLQDFLGRGTRRNVRRSMREIEELSGFRMTKARADNIGQQIDTLLMLHQVRLGVTSSPSVPKEWFNTDVTITRMSLRRAVGNPVRRLRPIGSLASGKPYESASYTHK